MTIKWSETSKFSPILQAHKEVVASSQFSPPNSGVQYRRILQVDLFTFWVHIPATRPRMRVRQFPQSCQWQTWGENVKESNLDEHGLVWTSGLLATHLVTWFGSVTPVMRSMVIFRSLVKIIQDYVTPNPSCHSSSLLRYPSQESEAWLLLRRKIRTC